jgi:flagellar biosynthesis/type III secretory pathway M-ring protein FliF/YscJ
VNQGMTIGGGAGGGEGQSTTMERNKVKMENHPGRIHKTIRSPAGALSVASASVTFPRSFFVKAYQSLKGDKEPNDAVLQPFISDQLEKLRKVIKACLNVPTDEAVVVDSYVDFLPAAVEAPTQTAGVSLLLGSHGKEIALGVLALASLFMVSMMVRKTGPAVATAGAAAAHPAMPTTGTTVDAMLAKTAGFQVASEDAAEVGEGGRTLDGIELDDEAIRAQQVVEQVSTMVKENPDAAANLIKRWMIRT